MDKGSAKRFLAPFAGIILVIGLPSAPASSRPSSGPSWWEIRLSATVNGGYSVKGGESPITGEFAFRARWEGTMERDGKDFLLYHLKSETLDWDLGEKVVDPRGASLRGPAEASGKPRLRLNYVLEDGKDIDFDFEVDGTPIPLHPFPVRADLELPRSAVRQVLITGSGYGDHVTRGSNRVAIPTSDLERRSAERTFSWEWRRQRRIIGDSKTFLMIQEHRAEFVVTLIAH